MYNLLNIDDIHTTKNLYYVWYNDLDYKLKGKYYSCIDKNNKSYKFTHITKNILNSEDYKLIGLVYL